MYTNAASVNDALARPPPFGQNSLPPASTPVFSAHSRHLRASILLTLARRSCFSVHAPSQAPDLDVRLGSRSPLFMSFCASHEVQAPGKCRVTFHKLLQVLGMIRVPYKRFEALPALTVSNSKPVEARRIATEYFFPTGLSCSTVHYTKL